MSNTASVRDQLLALAAELGDPRQMAILGEGNVSGNVDADTFLVKASGTSLQRLKPGDLVRVRRHLLLDDTIHIHCPVRLLHSLDDPDVPWETSLRIMRQLSHDDVRLILLKDAGHRVSRPEDLALVMDSLEDLLGSADTR